MRYKHDSSKFCICKYLSYAFPIQNAVKERNSLSPVLFSFALGYATRKMQEKKVTGI
jgi:hypothetical protein